MSATIPRPDPAPTCVRYDGEASQPCPETAVGVDCDGPACAKHMCGEPLCNKRSLYAPAEPAPVEAPDLDDQRAAEVLRFLDREACDRVALVGAALRRRYQEGQAEERTHSIKVIAKLRDHMRRMALKTSADAEKYEALAREAREIERSYLAAANGLVDAGTRLGDGEAV